MNLLESSGFTKSDCTSSLSYVENQWPVTSLPFNYRVSGRITYDENTKPHLDHLTLISEPLVTAWNVGYFKTIKEVFKQDNHMYKKRQS